MIERSVEETARGLGTDATAYRRLMVPIVEGWDALLPDLVMLETRITEALAIAA